MKKLKLKGPVLELLQKMDWEGGVEGFIGWGGLTDDLTAAVAKKDGKLWEALDAVKSALDAWGRALERYESYTGTEEV